MAVEAEEGKNEASPALLTSLREHLEVWKRIHLMILSRDRVKKWMNRWQQHMWRRKF
jgi:hypothetical protein